MAAFPPSGVVGAIQTRHTAQITRHSKEQPHTHTHTVRKDKKKGKEIEKRKKGRKKKDEKASQKEAIIRADRTVAWENTPRWRIVRRVFGEKTIK